MKNIYDGPESALSLWAKNDPDRKSVEKEFAKSVRGNIREARNKEYVNLWLTVASLRDPTGKQGFKTWIARIGIVLGAESCAEIAKKVCEEEGFTLEEAEKIYDDWRKDLAHSHGLPETATWDEIHKITSRSYARHG